MPPLAPAGFSPLIARECALAAGQATPGVAAAGTPAPGERGRRLSQAGAGTGVLARVALRKGGSWRLPRGLRAEAGSKLHWVATLRVGQGMSVSVWHPTVAAGRADALDQQRDTNWASDTSSAGRVLVNVSHSGMASLKAARPGGSPPAAPLLVFIAPFRVCCDHSKDTMGESRASIRNRAA